MDGEQASVGESEGMGDERSEAPRSGGSPTLEREASPTQTTAPDPEVTARHARRRFTTRYKLEILRKADTCTQPGQEGELLRKEGLYSSHVRLTGKTRREAVLLLLATVAEADYAPSGEAVKRARSRWSRCHRGH